MKPYRRSTWTRLRTWLAWLPFRHRRRWPERTVWCVECGREMPVSQAVVVAEVPDDEDERDMLGGTACVVEFCPEHAPADA